MMNKSNIHYEVISPVAFNAHKHHLGYLRYKICDWRNKLWDEVLEDLKLIGDNLFDLYYGQLTVHDISMQIVIMAKNNNITSPAALAKWLEPTGYKKTELSDTSLWIIRKGNDRSRFLHIHPAKYSPYTIRVQAPALKTVLAMQVHHLDYESIDVRLVNRIRVEKLKLSPIKKLEKDKGLARLMLYFNNL